MTTITTFENNIIDSYNAKDPDWIPLTMDKVMYFHETRDSRTSDPSTAQAKSFSAIRRGIYAKLPKVKTGDEYIDKQETRWDQTKALTMKHPEYDKLVEIVDPIHLVKYNKASKAHNVQIRARVEAKQSDAVKKFSITKSMETAFEVLKDSDDIFELFVALLYATGRRQHLLWEKMLFEQVDWSKDERSKSPYFLKVSAFAKSINKEAAVIPCLFNEKIVLKRIAEVREFTKGKGNVNSYNREISKACKRMFPDAVTTHQLRALYAETCNRIFNNDVYNEKQIKTAVYKKNALHHGSINTTNEHYETIATDLQSDAEVTEYHKVFEDMNDKLKK